VGTLYVVSAPAGDPDDLTRRALRIFEQVELIVAGDEGDARQLLDHYAIATPMVPAAAGAHLEALAAGDVALLCTGISPAPSASDCDLIRGALDGGYPVVPVPGPSLPSTALVISGLPADSFFYLGELPQEAAERRELLAAVGAEHRSIVALAPRALLPAALADLHSTLGDRPLAVVASSACGAELVWRGRVGEIGGELAGMAWPGPYVLVVGGAPDEAARWDEDRVCLEIQNLQAAGLRAKEISRQLAANSGWSGREIYRLSVELASGDRALGGETDAG
jgi:16S rRNA (cytidine1402-2'-O)-methyltransferase